MGIISILLIAVGLAMDSLAVSISGGIVMRPFCMRQSLRLALTMGIFQGGMTFSVGSWESASARTLPPSTTGLPLSFLVF